MIPDDILIKKFRRVFLRSPEFLAQAPGRVNLIGEHTDYNGGFVLPAAINRGIKMAVAVREDSLIHLYSENYNDSFTFDLSQLLISPNPKSWSNYFMAVVNQFLKREIKILGMEVYLWGDIPPGAGLSSSAAYEVCVASLLNAITNANLSKKELALLSQSAEHSDFVGVQCGIMDQFISVFGESHKALLLDCFNLEFQLIQLDSSQATIVIINTMKKRGLVDSEYNQRRKECEEGLNKICSLSVQDFPTIRHIPYSIFQKYQEQLSEKSWKRVKHNITENQRVQNFAMALQFNDFKKAGQLLYESHFSLRDDYEVSCKELDRIVEIAQNCTGVYGCRMTGAGFGGCAVALVEPNAVENFSQTISKEYYKSFSLEPEIYISSASDGASIFSL